MFSLLRSLSLKSCVTQQIPTLGASIVIAELFYKFHSFALECGAFLLTWFVLDAFLQASLTLFARRAPAAE